MVVRMRTRLPSGTLNPAKASGRLLSGFASTVKAMAKQAGIRFVQQVADVGQGVSWAMVNTFFLYRPSLANQSPEAGRPAVWQQFD